MFLRRDGYATLRRRMYKQPLRSWARTHRLLAAAKSRSALLGAVLLALALTSGPDAARGQENLEPVIVKGQVKGGQLLINPVWAEAAKEENHRYTFRARSATVGSQATVLRAYLPKELCIVALANDKVEPNKVPTVITVSGGRTTPVTLVVTEKQQHQFENHDPFPHKLYDVKKSAGLNPNETASTNTRSWTPPGPGSYEVRDELFPSVRSWIVVEPKAAAHTFPNYKGAFQLKVKPGSYTLRAYFNGEPVGKPLKLEVGKAPEKQLLKTPLVVAEPPKKNKTVGGKSKKK